MVFDFCCAKIKLQPSLCELRSFTGLYIRIYSASIRGQGRLIRGTSLKDIISIVACTKLVRSVAFSIREYFM
jgi:hypothetical protein